LTSFLGVVLKESPIQTPSNDDDDDEKHLAVTHKFRDFTYWNLDLTPSADDKIMQVMKWIDIANVVYFSHLSLIYIVLGWLKSRVLDKLSLSEI